MFGIESLGGNAQAAVLVGLVLVEALVLYVGYGWLETVLGPSLGRVLRGRCAALDLVFGQCPAPDEGGVNQ
jgi:hypothetical protein